jgi:uncharacterized protein (TIGR03492 family)
VRVTLLSNGHGEDAVGALLAEALRSCDPAVTLQAFPTVGAGRVYEQLGLPVLGPRRTLPSGGLMLHTAGAFWADLRAGFLSMTAAQLRALRGLETDVLVVIGDLYALLLGSTVRARRRFYVQTLVSVQMSVQGSRSQEGRRSPNRYFMERFSLPERYLMRRLLRHSYVRDAPTAAFLAGYGLPVSALGNPMLDALEPASALEVPLTPPVVALLPGTRSYQAAALERMVRALERWPEATGLIAWPGEVPPAGWSWQPVAAGVWRASERLYLATGRFAEVLEAAQLVLGTAGTANEQAAALGRPVVAFPVPPLYTAAFLANQRRLLGDALTLCEAAPESIVDALRSLWARPGSYKRASEAGKARMGGRGGARAIARDILSRAG